MELVVMLHKMLQDICGSPRMKKQAAVDPSIEREAYLLIPRLASGGLVHCLGQGSQGEEVVHIGVGSVLCGPAASPDALHNAVLQDVGGVGLHHCLLHPLVR